jgi:hypothetical protein
MLSHTVMYLGDALGRTTRPCRRWAVGKGDCLSRFSRQGHPRRFCSTSEAECCSCRGASVHPHRDLGLREYVMKK